jgi:hypothetical protein
MKQATKLAVMLGVMAMSPVWALGQAKPPEDRRLGIHSVEVTDAAKEAARVRGASEQLSKIVQSLDAQLMSAFDGTRKFELVAYKDLPKLLEASNANQSLAGNAAFQWLGCRYAAMVKIDDFRDIQQETVYRTRKSILERSIEISAVVLIYDTQDGRLLRSVNLPVRSATIPEELNQVGGAAQLTEGMVIDMSREVSRRTAEITTDQLFPIRVVTVNGNAVVLNRGEWFRYPPGTTMEVYRLGEDQVDPDTGRSLGRSETRVGLVRVESSTPETTRAVVVQSDGPIERGFVARIVTATPGQEQQQQQPGGAQQPPPVPGMR